MSSHYHVPEKGERVALDVDPAAVGLHGVAEPGDELSVLRHRVTGPDGVCVVVAASWDPTTYRLGLEHIRPAGDESK
jgi:hypothetical protein